MACGSVETALPIHSTFARQRLLRHALRSSLVPRTLTGNAMRSRSSLAAKSFPLGAGIECAVVDVEHFPEGLRRITQSIGRELLLMP